MHTEKNKNPQIVILKSGSSLECARNSILDSNVRAVVAMKGSRYFDFCVEALFISEEAQNNNDAVVILKENDNIFSIRLINESDAI